MAACPLSSAELDVLQALARGLHIEQVAQQRRTAPSTIRSQLNKTYRKLGVADRAQAVVLACCEGWIDSPMMPRAERHVRRLAEATEHLARALDDRREVTPEQRRYLAAFDDLLYARSDRQKREARAAMRVSLEEMLHEVPEDPVERLVNGLLDRRAARQRPARPQKKRNEG